jgi:pimeloyl-ACP methyl ester carboxylesterase
MLCGKKGVFTGLLAITAAIFCSCAFLQGKYTIENCPVGAAGAILSRSHDAIQDAIVERVVFYPKLDGIIDRCIERNGLLVRYKDAVATVLICHGFMCDKFDSNILRQMFPKGQFNVMTFDFRAHGEKRGQQFCTLGRDEAYDVIAAAQFLKAHPDLQGKQLFVYGFSMGAVAAIEAQAKDGSLFNAMILDCPFDSAENIIKRGLEHLKITVAGYTFSVPGRSLLQKYAFHPYVQSLLRFVLRAVANMDSRGIAMRVFPIDPVKSVTKVSVPTFYIHCKKDAKVTVDAIKQVYQNTAAIYKQLWLTNGRFHFDSYFYNPEKYTEQVRIFLDKAVNGSMQGISRQEIMEDEDDEAQQRVA